MTGRRETYSFRGAQFIGGSQRPFLQPVLPVIIWGPDGKLGRPFKAALVDTGADFCMCPSKITKPIGYKILSGKPFGFGGAVAKGKAWLHSVDITIMTHDYRTAFYKLSKVPVALTLKRNPVPLLLGRNGFLDQFVIHIDFPNKLFTLEMP